MSDLTLEKMKVNERLGALETTVQSLDNSVQEVKSVLFGDKGEKGVVGKLNDMVVVAKKIDSTITFIARLIIGTIIVAALPSITAFVNSVLHLK